MVVAEPMQMGHDSMETKTWQAHRDELYRFVLNRMRDKAVAEDIVHDVLLKAYAGQHTLKDASKLRSWLYQITRNAIIDHYRLRRPTEVLTEEVMIEEAEEEHRAERELAGCLTPLIDELPEPYRDALMLAEIEGTTQREVASRLGLSLSGAKSRVQRARLLLRGILLKCLNFD